MKGYRSISDPLSEQGYTMATCYINIYMLFTGIFFASTDSMKRMKIGVTYCFTHGSMTPILFSMFNIDSFLKNTCDSKRLRAITNIEFTALIIRGAMLIP